MRDLYINARILIPNAELAESFVRSTGPGGQNVNKVSSKVELRWNLASSAALSEVDREYLLTRMATQLTEGGELIVTCEEERTQVRNRERVREKMCKMIREALHRPKKRRPTKPSKGVVRRRLEGKRKRAQVKKSRNRKNYDE